MTVSETSLPSVILIEPDVYVDGRGFFMETWNRARYEEAGLPGTFVQDNLSSSKQGVLRGLHYQHPQGQSKLVWVLEGEVFDVAVDIRLGSPTFGQWAGIRLSSENRKQLCIPEGFAHGFCVLSERALFAYKCTDFYNAETEHGILWNDPEIGIDWPIEAPVLSEKDADWPLLSKVEEEKLPRYVG